MKCSFTLQINTFLVSVNNERGKNYNTIDQKSRHFQQRTLADNIAISKKHKFSY